LTSPAIVKHLRKRSLVWSWPISYLLYLYGAYAVPTGRAVSGMCLRPLAWWGCGFESNGCLSFVSVVCCQV